MQFDEARLAAMTTVLPDLKAFYASLSDAQKESCPVAISVVTAMTFVATPVSSACSRLRARRALRVARWHLISPTGRRRAGRLIILGCDHWDETPASRSHR